MSATKKKRGFMDGYATYDENQGRGDWAQWRHAFNGATSAEAPGDTKDNQAQRQTEAGTPYGILGVRHLATWGEVQTAYRQLARQHHPDINPENRAQAEEKMKEINAAFLALKRQFGKHLNTDRAKPQEATRSQTAARYARPTIKGEETMIIFKTSTAALSLGPYPDMRLWRQNWRVSVSFKLGSLYFLSYSAPGQKCPVCSRYAVQKHQEPCPVRKRRRRFLGGYKCENCGAEMEICPLCRTFIFRRDPHHRNHCQPKRTDPVYWGSE